jgi:flagellar basal-body rod protein FlgC
MSLFDSMRVSSTGLAAERFRMDITAGNLANADTVASKPGQKPFCRQLVEATGGPDGVKILGSVDAADGIEVKYDPDQPGPNNDNLVYTTKVNPVTEMLDMMSATRSYEANVKAFNSAKGMARSALDIGKA